jgi:hypothetical protein
VKTLLNIRVTEVANGYTVVNTPSGKPPETKVALTKEQAAKIVADFTNTNLNLPEAKPA